MNCCHLIEGGSELMALINRKYWTKSWKTLELKEDAEESSMWGKMIVADQRVSKLLILLLTLPTSVSWCQLSCPQVCMCTLHANRNVQQHQHSSQSLLKKRPSFSFVLWTTNATGLYIIWRSDGTITFLKSCRLKGLSLCVRHTVGKNTPLAKNNFSGIHNYCHWHR